mgnify:CR=1 FL=1
MKLKTEEMWQMQVCIYQNGYSESALQYISQRAGGNDVGMQLMW